MALVKKKRGRPMTARTLTRKRVEELLRNIPPAQKMTAGERAVVATQLTTLDALKKQMLKDHKSPPMPAKNVYEVESASHELMTNADIFKVETDYERVAENIRQGQLAGGKTLADRKNSRRETVLRKNPVLLEKLAPGGRLVSNVAETLHDDWDKLGDGLPKPSKRSLRRWFKAI